VVLVLSKGEGEERKARRLRKGKKDGLKQSIRPMACTFKKEIKRRKYPVV
jgi:hypothetical protein